MVSGTPAKLEQYGAQYGVPKTHHYSYETFDRIADNPDIDAVYIILPNSMHAEYTIRAARAGKQITGLSDTAAAKLMNYSWPGNVRELRNVIERAVAGGAEPVIAQSARLIQSAAHRQRAATAASRRRK